MNARLLGYLTALAILVADHLSKWFMVGPMQIEDRGLIKILPIFDLRFVPNYGVSMGFLVAGSERERWMLVAMTAAIAVLVGVWLWREKARADVIALGLVLGGAVGNIGDRVRLGYVVDFLDLHFGTWHPFLVFNVADAAITIGVVMLVLRALFVRDSAPKENGNAV
jgi:signal peptidase II